MSRLRYSGLTGSIGSGGLAGPPGTLYATVVSGLGSQAVYARLADTSGTTAADSSGSSHPGTYVGTPTLAATGLLAGDSNKAVILNGTSQYISWTGAWICNQGASTFSVVGLVKPSTIGAAQSIYDAYGASDLVFKMEITAAGKLSATLRVAGGTTYAVTGATTLVAGSTYHVATVYDGSTFKVYVNGALDGTTTSTTGNVWFSGSGTTLNVGRSPNANNYFGGTVDEILQWNTALTAANILSLYQSAFAAAPTTHTFTAPLTYANGSVVPTLGGSDHFMLSVLDSTGALSEVMKVTAYNSGSGAATIVRGLLDTAAIAHASADKVIMGAYPDDLDGSLWDDSMIAPVTPNDQTGTTYTFVLADRYRLVTANNASAQTYTVPLNSSVAYPLGSVLTLFVKGTGQVTLVGSGAVVLSGAHGLKSYAQYAMISLTKIASDTWAVSGDTAA